MSLNINPTHPKYLTKGKIVYNRAAEKFKVADQYNINGMWYLTLVPVNGSGAIFYEYDEHDYTGNGSPALPEYSTKKPKKEEA